MGYQTIDVKPLSGALGAEISGVDLAKNLSNQAFDEIHQAFLDHQVIFIRDQDLTPADQAKFGRMFGQLADYPFMQGLAEEGQVFEILKTEQETENFGSAWHSDMSYMERPPLATMLYAREIPETGGDTLYASTYQAYEALSDGMKAMLDGVIGVNSADPPSAPGRRAQKFKDHAAMASTNVDHAIDYRAEHPIVRTHPETGRKALYLNAVHTHHFKDMTEAESKPLIDYLAQHITRPEFTARFRWSVGAVAVWDNRCAQHYAINDYPGRRRRMHRLTIQGDRPV